MPARSVSCAISGEYGALQHQLDGEGIDDVDVVERGQFRLAERARHGQVAVERKFRGLGVERLAVLELDAGPQLDRDLLAVGGGLVRQRELRHDVELFVDVEQLVAERRRTRCGRHRCAPASDRECRGPRPARCAAWSGPERLRRTTAATPPRSAAKRKIFIDWSPMSSRLQPTAGASSLTISTPAGPAPSAPALKAATNRSSAGEKPPSAGTMASGGGSSAVRWQAVACPVASASSCGRSMRQRSIT